MSKLFPKIVDSLRFIYRKYMIMFLRMNMIYTEEKSDLTQTMIWLSLLDGFEIILLKHEHLEHDLMNRLNLQYDEAHSLAESKYNYNSALKDFKNNNNL